MNAISADLALAPLGAGDLIDRAVRLYRRHFFTLIRISAPPVLVSALGWTIDTIAGREISSAGSSLSVLWYFLWLMLGMVIILAGALFSLIVMAGATRNLVAHLLSNEPVTFRKQVGDQIAGGAGHDDKAEQSTRKDDDHSQHQPEEI